VVALLPEALLAPFVAVWLALLSPLEMSPPAMFTGTLAFTAFWLALAFESATCTVSACWPEI
jgi:hypothetical protein